MTTAVQGEAVQSAYGALMRRALTLAANGPALGPNPRVGCVLVDATGTIVAEGWHRGAGTPHAEVDALHNLAGTGLDARGLTAVVTLEPCNHTGRTGPCSVALIEAGVARVVYSVSDPGDASSGGAQRLRDAGIEVIGGVLADEVTAFLHVWLTAATNRRPYVTVKWASSLDGRAAANDGSSQWITGTAARQRVHEQRAANAAILVGTGTVLADDPTLTARGDAGELLAAQPIPVVIGERDVPADAKLRSHPAGLIETHSRDLGAVLVVAVRPRHLLACTSRADRPSRARSSPAASPTSMRSTWARCCWAAGRSRSAMWVCSPSARRDGSRWLRSRRSAATCS